MINVVFNGAVTFVQETEYDSSEDEGSVDTGYTQETGQTQDTGNSDPYFSTAAIAPETFTYPGEDTSGAVSAMASTLQGIVSILLRCDAVSTVESAVLRNMIEEKNEYLAGAYELFLVDGDLEELQDTMVRCVQQRMRQMRRQDESPENSESSEESEESESDDSANQANDNLANLMDELNVENTWSRSAGGGSTIGSRYLHLLLRTYTTIDV